MKNTHLGIFLAFLSSANIHANELITGKDIPQVLGVWYGQYQVDENSAKTEMWMEISFQKSINGYEIHGYNRWNVLRADDELGLGAHSKGLAAQQFDTVSGRISTDGIHIQLWEDHSKAQLNSVLLNENSLQLKFIPQGSATTLFETNLKRIDTHYSPGEQTHIGVDVSHHSGEIDWSQVIAQGYHFAYVKASEGVDNPDAMFDKNWQALRELNFPRGAYHFYVSEDDPGTQARFFCFSPEKRPWHFTTGCRCRSFG